MKELDLVNLYILNDERMNPTKKHIKEAGYRQKKIDLIEIGLQLDEDIHGVEVKVRNWKLGFQQCLGNRNLTPLNSLAIYHQFLNNIDLSLFKNNGIGLISIEENKNIQIIKPKKSQYINRRKYEIIVENLKNKLIQ